MPHVVAVATRKRFWGAGPTFWRWTGIPTRSNTSVSNWHALAIASPCDRRISGAPSVSSRQLENAERGFSFMRNGPLDMRMDPRGQLTAATIVNEYSEEQLTRLFRELGEEPAARRIASLIVKMRKTAPFRETLPLARAIEKLVGRHGRHHPATQVFQALRMEVNDELGALEEGLRVLTARLERGGRIAVI